MKLIEPPPEWSDLLKEGKIFELLQQPEVKTFIQRINDRYLYWDEMKYHSRPTVLDEGAAWTIIKISRLSQMRYLSLIAKNGKEFEYWLPDCVQRALHFIDQNATGQILIDEPDIGAERDRYIISSLMEEAIASSILEGAATTRNRAKEMLREGRKPKTRGEVMILNNYETMKRIKEHSTQELSIDLLCELQAAITRNTLEDPSASGRFRREDEDIRVINQMDGSILHTPPPAKELYSRIKSLCQFANETSEETFIHPVIKGIILHFWLAYEHPFVDGNGRTARALFYWFLMKQKYWLIDYLPISRIILKAPAKYKMAFLYSEEDDRDLTYFIKYNLRAFRLSIEDLKKYIARKQTELREARKLLIRIPGLNHRQQELINHALHHPDASYTLLRHMSTNGIVYQTARTDLFGLVEKKLLIPAKHGRMYVFHPHPDLSKKLR